jgi:hypothetical protein
MSELYFTCPVCKTPNFTRKGLRSHMCRVKGKRENYLGHEASMPLSKEEWQAVVGGMGGHVLVSDAPSVSPVKGKRTLSPEAREKLADAQRARREATEKMSRGKAAKVAKPPASHGKTLSRSEPHNDAAQKDCAGPLAEPVGTPTTAGSVDDQVGTGLLSPQSRDQQPGTRVLTLDALETLPPMVPAVPNPDAEMSADVTAQYHRATGGMVEVLKFGAMLMQLREGIDSTRGIDRVEGVAGAKYEKGTGLKAWLEAHCPEVKISTAWRFLTITEGMARDVYPKLVGPKVAKTYSLPQLVNTAPTELPEPAREKQEALFDFVRGTSQRSWLDGLKGQSAKGGDTTQKPEEEDKRTDAEKDAEMLAAAKADAVEPFRLLSLLKDEWKLLNDAEIEGAIDIAKAWIGKAEAWIKLPKNKRPVIDVLKALRGEAAHD